MLMVDLTAVRMQYILVTAPLSALGEKKMPMSSLEGTKMSRAIVPPSPPPPETPHIHVTGAVLASLSM